MAKKFRPFSTKFDSDPHEEQEAQSPAHENPGSDWDRYFDSRKYARPSLLSLEFMQESEYPVTDEGVGLLRGAIVQSHAFSTILALMYRGRLDEKDGIDQRVPYPDDLNDSVAPHIRKAAMGISKKYLTMVRCSDDNLHTYINTLPPHKAWPFFVREAVYGEFGVDIHGRLPAVSSGERPFALVQPKDIPLLDIDDKLTGGKWASLKQKVATRLADEFDGLRDVQARLISHHGLNLPYILSPGLIEAAFEDTLYRGTDITKLKVSDWLPKAANMAINKGIATAESDGSGGKVVDYYSGSRYQL